ncbi:MAG: DUF481 domain-containing protein [Bacteroidales bacterium]|nr:DUF481 domain-containing protein [Bacteroidales bacterium]
MKQLSGLITALNINIVLKTGFLFLILITGYNGYSQKNDTLYFLNGDRISGEIKQYKYGYLTYKNYGVSTVKVKYDKITTFYSEKSFDILLSNGSRRYGSFDTSRLEQTIKIITVNDTILTPFIEIVEIVPIKSGFWRKLTGNVDIGYSYSKANLLSQLSAGGNVSYLQRKYHVDLKVSTLNTMQEDRDDVLNNEVSLGYFKRIKNNWFAGTGLSGDQNTELGINLRIQSFFVIGNEVIHTNSNNLLIYGGLVVNKEFSADTTFSRWNLDGVGTLSYRLFRFHEPEINITSDLSAFPSFTVAGRYRITYSISAKIEIVSDLYFNLTFYENYDSKPPSETASNSDYHITTSLGYSF